MSKSLYALRCGLSEKTKQNKKQGGGGGCGCGGGHENNSCKYFNVRLAS